MDERKQWIHIWNAGKPLSKIDWGRCTQKKIASGTRLYFTCLANLLMAGLLFPACIVIPEKYFCCWCLAENYWNQPAGWCNHHKPPDEAVDPYNLVVAMDIEGIPDVNLAPVIRTAASIFIDKTDVSITSDREILPSLYHWRQHTCYGFTLLYRTIWDKWNHHCFSPVFPRW